MTTSVRFVLSLSKQDFIAFKEDMFSMKFDIAVTDVVNDVKYCGKSVNTMWS